MLISPKPVLKLVNLLAGIVLFLSACALAPPANMVEIPAGWFTMGQDNARRSNRPQHQIYLDAFWMDRTEVTNAAFDEFVAQTGFQPRREWDDSLSKTHGDEPVMAILWNEAAAYCEWMGKRLPTEAEWEKAARSTDGRTYPWGDTWDSRKANTVEGAQGGVLSVGSFATGSSPYGVMDMCGNVAEWVNDYFAFDYYTRTPSHNPGGPDQILDHGLRGGSWADPAEFATTFFRNSSHSVLPNPRVGFRCAQDFEN